MRMVCLANSRKLNGRCIAGKQWEAEIGAGNWIRPVSLRDNGEVSEYERQYEDGRDPRVLDILEIPMLRQKPADYQTENWLLDPGQYWRKCGEYSPLDLSALVDPVEPLWLDGHSTKLGQGDRIPVEAIGGISSSLRLVSVDELTLNVLTSGGAFGNAKRRVQGSFRHAGRKYALWVTDPVYERRFLAKPDGTYQFGNCHLTISLGEQFGDSVFKLIAAVIEPSTILTVGHSNHDLGVFIGLLKRHDVTALADVRSTPYSRFHPQFDRNRLAKELKPFGIKYVYLGRELGGRSDEDSSYERGQISYERLASTSRFREGLDRVIRGSKEYRVALMCAEKEPLDCHRTLLVGHGFDRRGQNVGHILSDGRLESHADAMDRLLVKFHLDNSDMVTRSEDRSREKRIDEAIALQAREVGHSNESVSE